MNCDLYRSGVGQLPLMMMMMMVLVSAQEPVVERLGDKSVAVDNMWTSADTINVSFLPFNLSHQKILVSVRQENDSSVLVVDTLSEEAFEAHDGVTPIEYQVDELQPDTKYELCVGVSSAQNTTPDALQSECYKVKTFPRVDNVRGVYAALAAGSVFLVACGLMWLLYRTVWAKYSTKVLKIEDSHHMQQPVEGQVAFSHGQDVITVETKSDVASTTTQ